MIHKTKVITFEVRSHGQVTRIDEEGKVDWTCHMDVAHDILYGDFIRNKPDTGIIKQLIWHLQDVLKCMKQIAKEKEAKKLPHLTLPSAGPDDLFKDTPLDERGNR